MWTEPIFLLIPEIILAVVAVGIYVAGAFFPARGLWAWIALGGIIVAAAALVGLVPYRPVGLLALDSLAYYVRWLALGAGGLFVLLGSRPLSSRGTPEYLGSLLLIVVGIMLSAGAGDIVLLFLGLELISIPTYIVLYLGRHDAASQEATAKYFFLSILASAMLLYGFSFLYGTAGSTDLQEIQAKLAEQAGEGFGGLGVMAKLAAVLIFAGLGFKIAAVPFHFYAPDVYQGTTHANAGLLSVAPKIAGLVGLVRVVGMAMEGMDPPPWRIALVLAVVTMTFGNVMALLQSNVRRLLAYSSIAHAGYMLIGLSVYLAQGPRAKPAWDGVGAILLYLLVYAVATIGTFAALACLGRGQKQLNAVEELAGLAWTEGPVRRFLAWAIGLFMFSLAGIPPLAGFWGKLALFASALGVDDAAAGVRVCLVILAVIGVLNAAVAAAYYLRIVGVMFFRMPLGTPPIRVGTEGAFVATVLCAVMALVIGLFPTPWIRGANDASPYRPRSKRIAVERPVDRVEIQAASNLKTGP